MTRENRYPAEVFWSDEDEGYIARAKDLPGCSAWGESEEEAVAELRAAVDAWIVAAKSAGNDIPRPSQPQPDQAYSGKLLVRMPRELHAELSRSAEFEGVSLNQYVIYSLASRESRRRTRNQVVAIGQEVIVGSPYHPARQHIHGSVVIIAEDPSVHWKANFHRVLHTSTAEGRGARQTSYEAIQKQFDAGPHPMPSFLAARQIAHSN